MEVSFQQCDVGGSFISVMCSDKMAMIYERGFYSYGVRESADENRQRVVDERAIR